MALPARDSLAGVVATGGAAAPRRLDALTVEDGRRGLRLAPRGLPHPRAEAVVEAAPEAAVAPLPEVAVDGRPRRVLTRQVPPGAARAVKIKDGVEHQPHVSGAGTTAALGGREHRFDNMPLSVGEVAGVELVAHPRMLPQPAETF